MKLAFKNKANRDAEAKYLKGRGYQVRRHSARNIVLHPEFINDWEGPVHSGFGNSQYQTWHSVVYFLDAD